LFVVEGRPGGTDGPLKEDWALMWAQNDGCDPCLQG
jgi:AhpD family alkylhydroperoxidase